MCLQELTLSPYFAVTPGGPGAAGSSPSSSPAGPPTSSPPAWLPPTASWCTRRSTRRRPDDGTALGFNTAILVAPDGSLVARTRKLHIPQGTRLPRGPLLPSGQHRLPARRRSTRRRLRLPDVLGPVVPRAGSCILAGRRRGARVPDRHRLRARPTRVRHRAAVATGDRRQRDRERHVHGGGQPHRRRRRRSPSTAPRSSPIPTAASWCKPRGDEPTVLLADLDLDARRDWLELFPFFRTRRPDTYGSLTRPVEG